MKPSLRELLAGPGPVLMDGAMGTELIARGLTLPEATDLWNVTRPEDVLAVHRSWVEAGARVLVTNTFGAHAPDRAAHVRAAVRLAREAAGPERLVLGDVGPGPVYEGLISSLAGEGVDGLLIESMRDAAQLESALDAAAREAPGVAVIASGTFLHPDALDELSPGVLAQLAVAHGAVAVGANCTVLPEPLTAALRGLGACGLPLVARAGILPDQAGLVDTWASGLAALVPLGARLLGGCCGTTPGHLEATAHALRACLAPNGSFTVY